MPDPHMSDPQYPNNPWVTSSEEALPPPLTTPAVPQNPMRSAAAPEYSGTASKATVSNRSRRRPQVSGALPVRPTADPASAAGAPQATVVLPSADADTEQLVAAAVARLEKELWAGLAGPMWMDFFLALSAWLILFSAQAKWFPRNGLLFAWPLLAAIATLATAAISWQLVRLGQRHQALMTVLETDWAEHGKNTTGLVNATEALTQIRKGSDLLRKTLIALQMSNVAYLISLLLH